MSRFKKSAVFQSTKYTKKNCPKISPKGHQDEATKESASHHSKTRKLLDDKIRVGKVRKSTFNITDQKLLLFQYFLIESSIKIYLKMIRTVF